MAGHRIASLLKASPEGEGFHPSQTVTLRLGARPVDSDDNLLNWNCLYDGGEGQNRTVDTTIFSLEKRGNPGQPDTAAPVFIGFLSNPRPPETTLSRYRLSPVCHPSFKPQSIRAEEKSWISIRATTTRVTTIDLRWLSTRRQRQFA